jgi:hypothetical protein
MNVMKTICGDLKESDDHMVSMAQKTVKERLAETLFIWKILLVKMKMAHCTFNFLEKN